MFAPAALLDKLFRVAVAAADPAVCMPPLLPPPPTGRTIAVGCVKAAAAMAAAVERNWDAPIEGLVVTRDGHGVTLRRIALCEAAHPHSDEASRNAATDMLARVAGLTRDDLVIALVSGGSSALLSLPAPGLSAADKALVLARLLHCGAPIRDINIVRRRLSANKGGGRLIQRMSTASLFRMYRAMIRRWLHRVLLSLTRLLPGRQLTSSTPGAFYCQRPC